MHEYLSLEIHGWLHSCLIDHSNARAAGKYGRGESGLCAQVQIPALVFRQEEIFLLPSSAALKTPDPHPSLHHPPPPTLTDTHTRTLTTHFKHARSDTQRHFVYPATSSHGTQSNHPGSSCVFVIYLSPLYIFIKQPDCVTALLPLHFLCVPAGLSKTLLGRLSL